VIVNKDNPTVVLTKSEITKLMLYAQKTWNIDGFSAGVEPINLRANHPIRNRFTFHVLGRSIPSVQNTLERQIFSGGKVPPPDMDSGEEVVAFVSSHPGAIGYIPASTQLTIDVKTIQIK
jgi:ABC-type phosphate transport system substrate-binding protein